MTSNGASGLTGMDFQAYLDAVEKKTGRTPRQFIALAHQRGLDESSVKAGQIVEAR